MRVLYALFHSLKKSLLWPNTLFFFFLHVQNRVFVCFFFLFLIASALLHAPSAIETHARLGNRKVSLCTVLLSSSCFSTALLLQSNYFLTTSNHRADYTQGRYYRRALARVGVEEEETLRGRRSARAGLGSHTSPGKCQTRAQTYGIVLLLLPRDICSYTRVCRKCLMIGVCYTH